MHKVCTLLYFMAFFLIPTQNAHANPKIAAEKGVLNLSTWDFAKQGPVTLKGEWEFYWQSLLRPDQAGFQRSPPAAYRTVPGFWIHKDELGKAYPAHGYASYHLQILLPKGIQKWGIDVAPFLTSGELYVNGKLLWKSGIVGSTKASSEHETKGAIVFFTSDKQILDIDILIANFVHPKAGIGRLRLGPDTTLASERESRTSLYTFLIGMIAFMGIYHIGLFLLRPVERLPIYFSINCCLNSTWTLVATGIIYHLLPQLNNEIYWKIFYVTWFLSYPAVTIFAKSLFPAEISKKFFLLCAILGISGALWALANTFEMADKAAVVFQIFGMFHYAYFLYAGFKAYRHGSPHVLVFFSGMTLYFCSVIHDVLAYEGIIDSTIWSPYGLVIFSLSQSFIMAARFSQAFFDLSAKEAEITSLNSGLENKVEEKTRDIRSIMLSIKQGIFMIYRDAEQKMAIHSDYSQFLEKMLNRTNIRGEDPVTLMFNETNVNEEQKSITKSILESSLGESSLAFEMNSANLLVEYEVNRPNQSRQFWELEWTPVQNADDSIEKILVALRDVTHIRQLQDEALDQQMELAYINEIVNASAIAFEKFIKLSHTAIEENQRLISFNTQKNIDVVKILFINMHTIKGNARSYKFTKMTGILHEIEHYYADLLNNQNSVWDQDQLLRDLQGISELIDKYEFINRVKLGRTSGENQVSINKNLIFDQIKSLDSLQLSSLSKNDQKTIANVRSTFIHAYYLSATAVFERILSAAERLARDLKKSPPTVSIDAPGIGLSSEAQELCGSIFTHIIRNSLDHGLEFPDERVRKGKQPHGQIELKMRDENNQLIIEYQDDGKGLNLLHLQEIGYQRGLLDPAIDYPYQAIADLIFVAGLSTSSQLSDISGRGVGMDAIKVFLEKAGGTIRLCLPKPTMQIGEFTNFYLEIILPPTFYTRTI